MKLLKLLLFIFAIYFVRRMMNLYKVMKEIQENQLKAQAAAGEKRETATPATGIVDAEYKVID